MRKPTAKIESAPAWKVRFRRSLLLWYDQHRRDLPWRKDRDPYRVWLSEVMLQQTRVAAVIDHYQRFLERFPSIEELAKAREATVLAAWSGLGYYRRARMLHAAARKIVKELGGVIPRTVEGLRALPGIGRYTAAAIASIAYGVPAAVVDGNVERVLQRVSGSSLADSQIWSLAEQLLSTRRPGDFNQALMELGATICLPRQPKCLVCPVFDFCESRGVLEEGAKTERQSTKEICYALDRRNGSVYLVRRPKSLSLMPGMWELPELSDAASICETWLKLRHSITVTDYTVRVALTPAPPETRGQWVANKRAATLPLTGLARKILRAAEVI